jgi:hypothetical protein
MKITSDLTNLTTAILILTVQMFIEWTLCHIDDQSILAAIVLWRTINLGRPVISLPSKCEAGIMFN